jgi:uncharacterized protein YfbU (UPF0304 family)
VKEENELSKVDRLILKNQFAILEFLTRAFPDVAQRGRVVYHGANTYAWYQRILESGSPTLTKDVLDRVYDVGMTAREEQEVLDILEMWGDLQRSYDALEDKEGISEDQVAFPGFDGNSSKGELFFARLFCFRGEDDEDLKPLHEQRPDRFDYVRPSPTVNSHFPMLDVYRRMMVVYEPMKQERLKATFPPMTANQIKAILAARTHPDYR